MTSKRKSAEGTGCQKTDKRDNFDNQITMVHREGYYVIEVIAGQQF